MRHIETAEVAASDHLFYSRGSLNMSASTAEERPSNNTVQQRYPVPRRSFGYNSKDKYVGIDNHKTKTTM